MKFSCEKHKLQSAINTASRACAGKSPVPALEGLLLETLDGNVRVTGYDLKKGIYTFFDADIEKHGSIVLSAKLFGEIVRSMQDDFVTIEVKDNFMTSIVCGRSDFSIIGSDAEEYPELPAVDYQSSAPVYQRVIKKMINETIFAVSDNESRPIYTGSLFEIENAFLTIVSVDGFRLALRKEPINADTEIVSRFVVPGAALSELEKICADDDGLVNITVGTKHIAFSLEDTVLISRRLEGEFLNYKKSIPSGYPFIMNACREDFMRTVDRVSLIIDNKNKNPLRCMFNDNEIFISCFTPLGKAEDSCSVSGTGKGIEIGFNNRYLKDALRVAPATNINICVNNENSPCIIVPEEENNKSFLYMILPVRLK